MLFSCNVCGDRSHESSNRRNERRLYEDNEGKMPQMFLGGVSEHVGKFCEKFINQLSICQQDVCHGVREEISQSGVLAAVYSY